MKYNPLQPILDERQRQFNKKMGYGKKNKKPILIKVRK